MTRDEKCAGQFGDFDVYECDLPVGHADLHHDPYGLMWTMGEPSTQPTDRCVKCGGPDGFHDPACVIHPMDHQPSDPSAKQVGTSPEPANETPESWHVDHG